MLLGWYAAALLRLDLKAYNLEPAKAIYVRVLALTALRECGVHSWA